ncbi:MAG: glycoside hydrolase family 95 protein, partial [Armatimonadetes bacterium]|nr:glycoside hydrolase family 95 protein [Armatimonadota bacterium]
MAGKSFPLSYSGTPTSCLPLQLAVGVDAGQMLVDDRNRDLVKRTAILRFDGPPGPPVAYGQAERWPSCRGKVSSAAWATCPRERVMAQRETPRLWYRQPAASWLEALPVGNGRLGAMVFGGVETERLQLNEESLWAGGPQEADNPAALEALPEVRRLLHEGRFTAAEELANATLICRGPGSNRGRGAEVAFGSHQTLGDLWLTQFTTADDYRRELDLATGVATTTWSDGELRWRREVFASTPGQVLVMRLSCNQPGQVRLALRLDRDRRHEAEPLPVPLD